MVRRLRSHPSDTKVVELRSSTLVLLPDQFCQLIQELISHLRANVLIIQQIRNGPPTA